MIEFFTVIGIFIVVIVIIAGFKTNWTFKNIDDGAIPSLLLAVGVTVLLFLGIDKAYSAEQTQKAEYFQYTELFAGVDYTKKSSPSCKAGGIDENLTSNIGLRQHLISYKDVEVIGQYTHHSCVIGEDDRQYDALGIHVVYRWSR